jgi:hypothetical protein
MGKSLHLPKDTVRNRSEGLCEKCGVMLTQNVNGIPDGDSARSIHHRQPQRWGGKDSVINLVNICIGCHREIHDCEEVAEKEGWIVRREQNPGNIPFNSRQGWVLPKSDGTLVLLDWTTGRAEALHTAPVRGTTRRQRVARRQRHRSSPGKRCARAA